MRKEDIILTICQVWWRWITTTFKAFHVPYIMHWKAHRLRKG